MSNRQICAVIPAAGRGSRLGLDIPKIAVEITDGVTVWHLLHRRLRESVQHVHVVVSPAGEAVFRRLAADQIRGGAVSMSVQDEPRGMGDAIFGAVRYWHTFDAILVVWGDQANLSAETVQRVVGAHRQPLTVPLVSVPDPYVEYEVSGTQLVRVRISREGDECRPGGWSDVGVFCLSAPQLPALWARYQADAIPGAATGEVNFLPFLPYLSQVHGWRVTVVPVADPNEARGINTHDDLDFARQAFLQCQI